MFLGGSACSLLQAKALFNCFLLFKNQFWKRNYFLFLETAGSERLNNNNNNSVPQFGSNLINIVKDSRVIGVYTNFKPALLSFSCLRFLLLEGGPSYYYILKCIRCKLELSGFRIHWFRESGQRLPRHFCCCPQGDMPLISTLLVKTVHTERER